MPCKLNVELTENANAERRVPMYDGMELQKDGKTSVAKLPYHHLNPNKV